MAKRKSDRDEGEHREDEADDVRVVAVRLQRDGVDEVKNRRDEDGRDAGECGEEEEELEAHPMPGGGGVAAPDWSDMGFTAEHDVEDRELEPRGEIKEHRSDDEADDDAGEDDRDERSGEGWSVTASVAGVSRREGEGEVGELGEEGDGGDFEEELRVARTEQKPAGVLPGRSDGVGGRERLHAAPLRVKRTGPQMIYGEIS